MNYKSPLCSCIVCHETKSAKGIFSHYLASHADEITKIKMVGNGNRKKPSTTKQKENAAYRRELYNANPNYCFYCRISLNYDARNNKFCSHTCAAVVRNTGRKKTKTSTTLEKNIRPNYIRAPYTKISQCIVCDKWFPGTRKTCSDLCYKSNNSKNGGYKENSTRVHRTLYKGAWMHSGSELKFAQMCDKLNIQWHKNTSKYFEFFNNEGKLSKYYPDFYIANKNIWVEIKGKRYIRPDDDKRRAAVDTPVFLILSNQFKKDFSEFLKFIDYGGS